MPFVSSIDIPLGTNKHVTIDDQAGGHILPDKIEWAGNLAGIVNRVEDNTGFTFYGLKVGQVKLIASVIGDPSVTMTFTINVTEAITQLQAESP